VSVTVVEPIAEDVEGAGKNKYSVETMKTLG
jgi:hypothetical protein